MITRLLKPKSATVQKPQGESVQAESDEKVQTLDAQVANTRERRRFPRPLPVPQVVEDHSDEAWEEFHKISDSNWSALIAPSGPTSGS